MKIEMQNAWGDYVSAKPLIRGINYRFTYHIRLCVRETREWFDIPLRESWYLLLNKTPNKYSYKCKLTPGYRLTILNPESGKWLHRDLFPAFHHYLATNYGSNVFYLGAQLL